MLQWFEPTVEVTEPKEKALKYVKEHPGCWTSDIAVDLRIDPGIIAKALEELKDEHKIK